MTIETHSESTSNLTIETILEMDTDQEQPQPTEE